MPHRAITALAEILRPEIALGKSRLETLCLFGDAKTRGLNFEDTRLTDPRKLDLLMGLVALAVAWAGRMATDTLAPHAPKRKTHGFYAKSWFRTGFDRIRQLLRTNPSEAIRPWWRLSRKHPDNGRVVKCRRLPSYVE